MDPGAADRKGIPQVGTDGEGTVIKAQGIAPLEWGGIRQEMAMHIVCVAN